MQEAIIVSFVGNFVAGQLKKYVPEQYQAVSVHAALFFGTIVYVFIQHPEMRNTRDLITSGIEILSISITLYEVLLKRISSVVPAFGKVF